MKKLLKNFLKIFWVIPVKKNRIVFRSSHGTKYNCNPKYISEYLQNNFKGKFEQVWIFDKDSIENHKYLEQFGIVIVNQKSLKGILYMITAKFLIDNHGLVSYIPIRKEQIVINTWHGGGSYKKEYSESTDEHKKYMKMMYDTTDAFISSCRKFSICNLKSIYESDPNKILEIGMPRNDLFWHENEAIKSKVKKELGISQDSRIVLYAPTFRYNADTEIYMLNPNEICKACEKRFGGHFVFVTRFHPFVEKRYIESGDSNFIISNQYEDMQELLYATDVLISDYSSCLWDASLSYIPSFIYAADLEYYSEKRNFHTPIKEWPYPLAETEDELVKNIRKFDENKYKENVDSHHKALGSFESGKACEKIAEYILEKFQLSK